MRVRIGRFLRQHYGCECSYGAGKQTLGNKRARRATRRKLARYLDQLERCDNGREPNEEEGLDHGGEA